MQNISLESIKKSIQTQTNNVVSFTIKQKSPILATVSAASFMASNFMLPPARSVALGASALAAALSVGSLASDLTEKATGSFGENLKEVKETLDKKINDVTNAMGGNVLEPIKLKTVTAEDKKKKSATQPIMDDTTKTAWDRITKWVSLDKKPTFNGRQSNYDCLYMYGPPGTGKTVFANALFGAVDNKYDFKLANITAGDLMERGAEKLNLLKKDVLGLIDNAKDATKPVCIGFFLDEVEGSLNKDRSLNAGVVNEYLTFINEIKDAAAHNPNVYILGALATNYDEQVDRASKRDGRVTETLHINYPNASSKPDDNTADTKKSDTPNKNNTVSKVIQDILLGDETNKIKGTIDKLDPRYNSHLQEIKKLIKAKIDDTNSLPIKQALSEENLTGASVENAVIKTQKDIALMTPQPNNIPDEFIKRLSDNIIQAAKIATQQRTKDDEELKARQALSVQLAGMREALEKMAGTKDVDNIKSIHENLKGILEKTGDNEQLEKIMANMGKKFEDMQKASAEDRKQIIQEISKFIQQVQKHSDRASDSARRAQDSQGKAEKSAEQAGVWQDAWYTSVNVLHNLKAKVRTLEEKSTPNNV